MLGEIAHIALITGVGCTAWVLFWAIAYPYYQTDHSITWQRIEKIGVGGVFSAIVCSYVLLTILFLQNDFSLRTIWEHSHDDLPWYYRATAVWGGHEGSWLLWLTILVSYWMVHVLSNQETNTKKRRYQAIIQALVVAGFGFFILFSSNPFTRLLPIPPFVGQDLNPLLQDPGFLIHPPCLYLGYVSLCIPYSIAVAQLLEESPPSKQELLAMKKWFLWGWMWLTAGLLLGSWWAYRELGWGGFWFWDPVENAALMPWLIATAAIHQSHQQSETYWPFTWIFLAITGFLSIIMGTFLVRSGIVVSVHAFAIDPARGSVLLTLFVLHATFAYGLWIKKVLQITEDKQLSKKQPYTSIWVELQTKVLLAMALVILLATLYPLGVEAWLDDKISVGPAYYEQTLAPLVWLLFGAMIMDNLKHLQGEKQIYTFVTGVSMVLFFYFFSLVDDMSLSRLSFTGWITLVFAFCAGMTTIYADGGIGKFSPKKCAHLCCIIIIMIVTIVKTYEVSEIQSIQPGQTISFKNYSWHFERLTEKKQDNYIRAQMHLSMEGAKDKTRLLPEMRYFPSQKTTQTKASIYPSWYADWYVAMAKPTSEGPFLLRMYYKPLQSWLWAAGCGLFLSGVWAWRKRHAASKS